MNIRDVRIPASAIANALCQGTVKDDDISLQRVLYRCKCDLDVNIAAIAARCSEPEIVANLICLARVIDVLRTTIELAHKAGSKASEVRQ